MAYSLRLISKAENDVADAIEWYLGISAKVAADFLEELSTSFELLKTFPEAFPIVHLDLRMYVLRRFPYKVVYLVSEQVIVVHAVSHHKLEPKKWQQRSKLFLALHNHHHYPQRGNRDNQPKDNTLYHGLRANRL